MEQQLTMEQNFEEIEQIIEQLEAKDVSSMFAVIFCCT